MHSCQLGGRGGRGGCEITVAVQHDDKQGGILVYYDIIMMTHVLFEA
mgnify:CR=1 FL=1